MPRRTQFHRRLLAAACAALVLLLASSLAGCAGDEEDAQKDRNFAQPIPPAAIVGEWQMTAGTRELFKRDGHVEPVPDKPYTLTFLDDGWVKFDSVVDDVKGGTYSKCLGTWLLEHDVVVNNKPAANVITLQLRRLQDRCFIKLLVTEQDKALRLWNTYGDPKKLEYIEYERPGEKKQQQGW